MRTQEPSRIPPADPAATRASRGRDRTAKRSRKRAVDGRTRAARAWRRHYQHFLALAGERHDQLARALASAICTREQLDEAIARGEMVDPLLLTRLSGEIRRLLARCGLDEEPAYDGTADAIAALRSQHEARP